MEASQALRSAIERKSITHAAFAKSIGASVTMLSLWLNGHNRPGLTFAARIQEATGIPATDWARAMPTVTPPKTKRPLPAKVRQAPKRGRAA